VELTPPPARSHLQPKPRTLGAAVPPACTCITRHGNTFTSSPCTLQQCGTPPRNGPRCPLGSSSALRHRKSSTNKHGGHALAPHGVGDASRRRSVLVARGDEDALSVFQGINTNPRGGMELQDAASLALLLAEPGAWLKLSIFSERRLVKTRNVGLRPSESGNKERSKGPSVSSYLVLADSRNRVVCWKVPTSRPLVLVRATWM
jgi:hypothetical protein